MSEFLRREVEALRAMLGLPPPADDGRASDTPPDAPPDAGETPDADDDPEPPPERPLPPPA